MSEIGLIHSLGTEETAGRPRDTLLEVKNLQMHFPVKTGVLQRVTGQVKAVDGVSFTVKKGKTIGIVGESGCGKSTMGRSIIRLYEPTGGEILYNGKDIAGLPEKQLHPLIRREIQMVFQDPNASLNPRKSLGSALAEPMKAHNLYGSRQKRVERIEELLDLVGLHRSVINNYPHEFSGGQRQRIGIARALVLNPELVIADEAVSALDVSVQAQIINLLEDLQEKLGLTYIFISHDLSVVRHISDRVGVMYLGKLVELSDKEALYEEPLHPYTQALLSAIPVIKKDGAEVRERIVLKGDLPSPSSPPPGCIFHTRCPYKMPMCETVVPDFREAAPGRQVACHLYGEPPF
ncbi:ABC transporter ATP-binding protein [Edaphobacillus lindanitolerans]|uniref:Peptide/nickel transport system ATP-binding protein/oligopeptide transport system ATP-binding protein n=1 Tax=Edaphobacillus lindanitolerans TaxID=550447 RepID=A0A1U7PKQ6_9BACI|nr:dipeptide ABC transporter ATP-binding protein [Edaphobacillus lindanitolerans]SIT71776.1 peptide/nickel transport system ATP-binding protein/oligopeptide transport system ATP-binding protein [Edaphobacillus lindanitolerans]